ncbi:MAG: permease, partial [Bryobacterales bacterium]|nr:permease [Bryobacterales bacterium]
MRDLIHAVRVLRKNAGFSAAAVLVLALGIGANTSIFSVVYAVLLKPLPYRDPGRLVVALHDGRSPVSPADYFDYRAEVHAFSDMSAAQAWGGTFEGPEKAEVIPGLQVSANMMRLLGVEPMLGRAFLRNEDQPGAKRVLLLSDGLWKTRFGGDRAAVGRSIRLNDLDYTVVGVMPPGFQFAPFWQTQAEMWTPLVLASRMNDRGGRSLRVFARLAPGVSLRQAQTQMDTVARRLEAAYPKTNARLRISVVPLHEKVVGAIRPTLLVLLATVGFVLIIACADITNLLLTRAAGRRKEMAVRLAIGARRFHIIRQMAMESLVLAALGGAGGLLLARLGLDLLRAALPEASLPRQQEVGIDVAGLIFTLAISLFAGLVSGLIPALQASRCDLNENLKEGARGTTGPGRRRASQRILVTMQV